MNDFITLTQLSTTFGVARPAIATWLVEIGLHTGNGSPTAKTVKKGWCRVLPGMVLWHKQRTIAALKTAGHPTANEKQAKDALTDMIATARSLMGWTEIQEVLIAMKAKEHGVEARII